MEGYVATGIIFAVLESPKSFTGTRHVRSCLIIILYGVAISPPVGYFLIYPTTWISRQKTRLVTVHA